MQAYPFLHSTFLSQQSLSHLTILDRHAFVP